MPGEALNHAFVTLAHLVDYAHCNNVKASVQMMEVISKVVINYLQIFFVNGYKLNFSNYFFFFKLGLPQKRI